MTRPSFLLFAVAVLAGGVSSARAQNPTPAPQGPAPLEVGAVAPDFTLPGATRYGVLREPIRLSAFRGKTVVLAFYFRSRTRG